MVFPWPRASNPAAPPTEEWDASRGIGDWRARMQRIYDAEAAADDDDDDDDDGDDDDDDDDGPIALDPAAAASMIASAMGRGLPSRQADDGSATPADAAPVNVS